MKIAIPYENGQVHPHLEQAEEFMIYDVNFDEIISSESAAPKSSAPDALASFLTARNVNVLICGALNVATVIALRDTAIQILGGAEGDAKSRVEDFLSGTLHFGSCSTCSSCASCSNPCGLRTAEESDAPCDGNVSACGVQ